MMNVQPKKTTMPRETVRCVYSVDDGQLEVLASVYLKAVVSGLDSSKAVTRIGYSGGKMRYSDSTLTYEAQSGLTSAWGADSLSTFGEIVAVYLKERVVPRGGVCGPSRSF